MLAVKVHTLYECIFVMQGASASILEVLAISSFVFLVLPELPTDLDIFLLCGVFAAQLIIDVIRTHNWNCRSKMCMKEIRGCYPRLNRNHFGYERVEDGEDGEHSQKSITRTALSILGSIFENKITKVLALLFQLGGIFALIVFWIFKTRSISDYSAHLTRSMIGIPLVLMFMSVVWSNWFQEKIAKQEREYRITDQRITARYKSSKSKFAIQSILKLIFFYKQYLSNTLVYNNCR